MQIGLKDGMVMTIHDKELEALVAEQTKLFLDEAPLEQKQDVLKRIQARQKILMKGKRDDE
jgi:hypothetical protein